MIDTHSIEITEMNAGNDRIGVNIHIPMDWIKLLSKKRLGQPTAETNPNRAPFQRDFDRIIFSAAFRRLQDKTQVHPLSESDYVRTRLTHSLETSCIGRSLGEIAGNCIIKKNGLESVVHQSEFGSIVANACLAHDIGNPPLGHSGEDAIRHWYKHSRVGESFIEQVSEAESQDFLNFEGNAQGFRVLCRLQTPDNIGGMQLTCATLAAYTKYPRESLINGDVIDLKRKSAKKFGFFQQDAKFFKEIAEEVGLKRIRSNNLWWCRHPLAFLVEAADDITYSVIDFEDGFRLGYIGYDEIENVLSKFLEVKDKKQLSKIKGYNEKVEYLRAKTIHSLIMDVVAKFNEFQDSILLGDFDESIISKIDNIHLVREMKHISSQKAYCARNVLEIEAAGFQVLGDLVERFFEAANDVSKLKEKASEKSKKLIQLIPHQFRGEDTESDDVYSRMLKITDFVSGMTDSFSVSLYKKISGISLPRG